MFIFSKNKNNQKMSSSTRETKYATKAQRKTQRSVKNQKEKVQPKQQNSKSVAIQHEATDTGQTTAPIKNKGTNKKNTTMHLTNSRRDNDFEDSILLSPNVPISRPIPLGYQNTPKIERSNSFSLKGKLSKFINSFTGSKENISKTHSNIGNSNNEINKNGLLPPKFTRSRSMILLRRSNRRSLIGPQLEQLSEEAEKCGNDSISPTSPRENSNSMQLLPLSTSTSQGKSPTFSQISDRSQRLNSKLVSSTPIGNIKTENEELADESIQLRKGSTLSLASGTGNGVNMTPPAFNPQLNFQKRRSNTLVSSFRSTIASFAVPNEKKSEKKYPKWSASLQSLQAIDNMVSYDNMSFINYDKFNEYEKQLEKRLSTMSLMDTAEGQKQQMYPLKQQQQQQQKQKKQQQQQHHHRPYNEPSTETSASLASPVFAKPQQTVLRRQNKRRKSNEDITVTRPETLTSPQNIAGVRASYNFDTDYEHNLDKLRNVYRDSLDSRKLEILNELIRDHADCDKRTIDALNLEDGSIGRRRRKRLRKRSAGGTVPDENSTNPNIDVPDFCSGKQMKSKSLTHLDGLDSMQACPRGTEDRTSSVFNNRGKTNRVPSSEYFSISFSTETGQQDEDFIPATKGVTLAAAINQALHRRNLTFSQVSIADNSSSSRFLEAGSSSLTQSLDENTDVENLAGRHLVIVERDGSRKPLQKAASFGSRTRPARLLSSISTEETSESTLSGKQLKQRWSGLFGGKNPQHNQLCELLNNYALSGVPQRGGPEELAFNPETNGALNYLDEMHKSWRDFVDCKSLSESESKIQTAIWELVTTEVYYIHALQMVTDLFVACLEALQKQNLLTEVDQHRLFANIGEICDANLKFWSLHLYPMVAHSIATRKPMRIAFFEEGFRCFATIFSPYTKYCAEQSSCQFYCKDLNINNAVFASYLAWCESQKMCNRLRLADILVRPMQRLTKYSLLLIAIKRHMTNSEDIEAVETMIHCVESFVASVNNYMTQRQEMERLKGVMARIESYEVVQANTNNEFLDKMIKQYSLFFDLCSAMKNVKPVQVRHLFMEGDHKFKDHLGKVDVHCFLFTDFLLVAKNVAKKGLGAVKVIRQPYFTDRLLVHQTHNTLHCVYLNEFNLAVTAFTLQCSEAKNWADALRRAKMIYIRLKQTASNLECSQKDNTTATPTSSKVNIASTTTASMVMTATSTQHPGTTNIMSVETLTVKKSPLNSSFGSPVSTANNSRSGSVEWNDSRNISVNLEKTNSFSSDDGSASALASQAKTKIQTKVKEPTPSAKTLTVQATQNLVQSLPNLNLHVNQHNNTLLVPDVRHTRNLLSPNFHNVSYPPPSPMRTTLRRASAMPKNPPLVKTRNITSQSSINWHQIPATPTPTSPHTTGPIIEGNIENIDTLMTTSLTTAPRSPPNFPTESDQYKTPNLWPTTSDESTDINPELHQQHFLQNINETDV